MAGPWLAAALRRQARIIRGHEADHLQRPGILDLENAMILLDSSFIAAQMPRMRVAFRRSS